MIDTLSSENWGDEYCLVIGVLDWMPTLYVPGSNCISYLPLGSVSTLLVVPVEERKVMVATPSGLPSTVMMPEIVLGFGRPQKNAATADTSINKRRDRRLN